MNIQQENLKSILDRVIDSKERDYNHISAIDEEIDSLWGLQIEKTERELASSTDTPFKGSYIGNNLKTEGLLTSYLDFYSIYCHLPETKGKTFVDLGAGYGRSAFLYSEISANLKTLAIEFVQKRIECGQKLKIKNNLDKATFIHQDLLKGPFPIGDYYFLYLPKDKVFFHCLNELKKLSKRKSFHLYVIESHGDVIDSLKRDYPWLLYKGIVSKTFSKRHDRYIHHFSPYPPEKMVSYEKKENELFRDFKKYLDFHHELPLLKIPSIWRHSFLLSCKKEKHLQVLIKDLDSGSKNPHVWMGSLEKIESSIQRDHYSFKYPEREIGDYQLEKIIVPKEKFIFWIELRRKNLPYKDFGHIRKVIVEPEIQIEFTKKGRIPLKDLL